MSLSLVSLLHLFLCYRLLFFSITPFLFISLHCQWEFFVFYLCFGFSFALCLLYLPFFATGCSVLPFLYLHNLHFPLYYRFMSFLGLIILSLKDAFSSFLLLSSLLYLRSHPFLFIVFFIQLLSVPLCFFFFHFIPHQPFIFCHRFPFFLSLSLFLLILLFSIIHCQPLFFFYSAVTFFHSINFSFLYFVLFLFVLSSPYILIVLTSSFTSSILLLCLFFPLLIQLPLSSLRFTVSLLVLSFFPSLVLYTLLLYLMLISLRFVIIFLSFFISLASFLPLLFIFMCPSFRFTFSLVFLVSTSFCFFPLVIPHLHTSSVFHLPLLPYLFPYSVFFVWNRRLWPAYIHRAAPGLT